MNPFNPANNINGVGKNVVNNDIDDADKGTLHSMNNGDVLSHQEAFVTKVLETLNDSDNVLFEILKEGGTKAWPIQEMLMWSIFPMGNRERLT